MRKLICLVLCLVMGLFAVGVAYSEDSMGLYYTYVGTAKANLIINSGIAEASGSIAPIANEKTNVIVRLQQERSEGYWTTIATWTDNNSSVQSEAGGTKAVDFGYNYRVYVTGRVYSSEGRVLESVNRYSQVKSYGASN